jgi:hypothetical protein
VTTSLSPKKRSQPLTAQVGAADEVGPILALDPDPADGAMVAERDSRFADGVRTLRVGGASLRLEERIFMVLGGTVASLGLIVVLLGWWGAAHSLYVFEQLPYLISGGLLGVGLIFLGAFFYFAHWMTQLVKEHRTQSGALLEALQRLQVQLAQQPEVAAAPAPAVSSNGTHVAAGILVATEHGTMAHRPECVVVAGKSGLRQVSESDDLAPCKLCEPFAAGSGASSAG